MKKFPVFSYQFKVGFPLNWKLVTDN